MKSIDPKSAVSSPNQKAVPVTGAVTSHMVQIPHTVKARNNALGGTVSKHPNTGRYLGPMEESFYGYQHSMYHTKKHVHMHAPYKMYSPVSIRSPPWACAFTRTWATTRVQRVDMLYLGAYTEGGRYYGLLR